MTDLPTPVPAATLILMREPVQGAPELLVMERAQTMAFAAGALVFPGGRVDPDDHVSAARHDAGAADAAARIAAVRETIEEAGIAAALLPPPDVALASALRETMAAGLPFSDLLERHGLAVDLDALTPFARWCPNFAETRRFDTLFYLAEAPADAPLASPDRTEAVHTFWASAADILAEIETGRAQAIFPTRRNLERLARFGSIAEARADTVRHPLRTITPWVEERDSGKWVCIPEDIGYPVTAEPFETARRR
jgi:8-oxo-dGTP pyrophosphatase MutT (NUDIX family)